MPDTTPRGYPYPCYTDPHDFPSDMQDLAEAVDTDVDNLLTDLGTAKARPAVIAAGPMQSIPNSIGGTQINFTVSSYDTGGFLTAPSTVFVAPVTGLYKVTSSFTFNTSDTNVRQIRLRMQTPSVVIFGASSMVGIASHSNDMFVGALRYMTAGSTFSAIAWQNSGVAIDIFSPKLHASLVSV